MFFEPAAGPPRLLYRACRHTYPASTWTSRNGRAQVKRSVLAQQDFFHKHVDAAVPSWLLGECLEEDIKAAQSAAVPPTNSVLCARNLNLVMHCAGENMETIVIRSPTSMMKPRVTMASCFNFNNETRVNSLAALGDTTWDSAFHFLAQSDYELRHYRTADVTEAVKSHSAVEVAVDHYGAGVCVEPLHKVCVPAAIDAIATSAVEAQLITRDNRVYFYDRSGRFTSLGAEPLFAVPLDNARQARCIEGSAMHPSATYASLNESVFSLDRRGSGLTKLISLEYRVAALKQSALSPLLLYVSFGSHVALFDARYTRTYLKSQSVPCPQTVLGTSISHGADCSTELFCSHGPGSRQILCHSVSVSATSSRDSLSRPWGGGCIGGLSPLLSLSATPLDWNVAGFQVLDRCTLGVTLAGVALCDVNQLTPDDHRLVLTQQSSSGDVFAQELSVGGPSTAFTAPVQMQAPLGARTPRYAPAPRDQSKLPRGLRMLQPISTDDRARDALPKAEARFMPNFAGSSLTRHSTIKLSPSDFLLPSRTAVAAASAARQSATRVVRRKTYQALRELAAFEQTQTPFSGDDAHSAFAAFLPVLEAELRSGASLSLWSIWKLLARSPPVRADMNINELRDYLSSVDALSESCSADPLLAAPSSDSLCVKRKAVRIDSQACECDLQSSRPSVCPNQDCVVPHALAYTIKARPVQQFDQSTAGSTGDVSAALVTQLINSWSPR